MQRRLQLVLFLLILSASAYSQNLRRDTITTVGRKYSYHGKVMSQNHLMSIMKKKDLGGEIAKEIKLCHRDRKIQTGFEIIAAFMLLEGVYTVGEYQASQYIPANKYISPESMPHLYLGVGFLGGGILAGLAVLPVRALRMKHARKVIELYNQSPMN